MPGNWGATPSAQQGEEGPSAVRNTPVLAVEVVVLGGSGSVGRPVLTVLGVLGLILMGVGV